MIKTTTNIFALFLLLMVALAACSRNTEVADCNKIPENTPEETPENIPEEKPITQTPEQEPEIQPEEKPEPKPGEIQPVKVSDELTAFFEENLHQIARAIPADRWGEGPMTDHCVMINSVDEFPKADWDGPFEFQYPYIDFDAYTLIIGMHTGVGLSAVVSHSIVVEQEMVTMTVRRRDTGEMGHTGPKNDYYWGLYPKLSEKSIINITVTYENKNF